MEDPIRPRGFSLPANVIHDTEFAFAVSKFVFDSKQKSFSELVVRICIFDGDGVVILALLSFPLRPSLRFMVAQLSARDIFNFPRFIQRAPARRRWWHGGGNKKNVRNMYFSSAPREEETHIPCLKWPLPRLRQPTDGLGRLSVAIRSGPLPRPRRPPLPSNSERDCVPKRLQGCVITCTESPLWEHREWANESSAS